VKTAVPSGTHKDSATAVCTELKKSEKRTALLQPPISLRHLFHSLQVQLSTLTTYRKLLGRLAVVFLAIGGLVGIATTRNTPDVSVVTAVPTRTEIIQAAKPEAAVASEPIPEPITGPTIQTAPLSGDYGFSIESPDQSIPTSSPLKTKEPVAIAKPEAIPSLAPPAIAEAPKPSPETITARKDFVEIAVQLTIQDGRVAQAQVENRQPGAEAFAATALHIARQRRYPPGTSRTETVVVRVANRLGRKEP
jgi:hypothetical protein